MRKEAKEIEQLHPPLTEEEIFVATVVSAKPTIDMFLSVSDSSHELSYLPQLELFGYVLKIREPNWYEHRVLKLQATKANLHVFSAGCAEIERMIAFRECLRNNPEDMKRYEGEKHRLSQKTWKYMQNYADAKSTVIREIMNRASS